MVTKKDCVEVVNPRLLVGRGFNLLADGQAIRKVARKVGLTPKTVWLTSQRYQQGGLEGAL
jgi:Homeodomain-like domain